MTCAGSRYDGSRSDRTVFLLDQTMSNLQTINRDVTRTFCVSFIRFMAVAFGVLMALPTTSAFSQSPESQKAADREVTVTPDQTTELQGKAAANEAAQRGYRFLIEQPVLPGDFTDKGFDQ